MKDHVEIDHLTKYDAFRVNRDLVMDLEIWLIAQNSATHPGPFLSLVALNLKSHDSKDPKQ